MRCSPVQGLIQWSNRGLGPICKLGIAYAQPMLEAGTDDGVQQLLDDQDPGHKQPINDATFLEHSWIRVAYSGM
jgi:hypothetical protein